MKLGLPHVPISAKHSNGVGARADEFNYEWRGKGGAKVHEARLLSIQALRRGEVHVPPMPRTGSTTDVYTEWPGKSAISRTLELQFR